MNFVPVFGIFHLIQITLHFSDCDNTLLLTNRLYCIMEHFKLKDLSFHI